MNVKQLQGLHSTECYTTAGVIKQCVLNTRTLTMVTSCADRNLYNGNILSFLPAELTCVGTVQFTQHCCTHHQLLNAYIMTQIRLNDPSSNTHNLCNEPQCTDYKHWWIRNFFTTQFRFDVRWPIDYGLLTDTEIKRILCTEWTKWMVNGD